MNKNKYYVVCDIENNVFFFNSFQDVEDLKLKRKIKEIKGFKASEKEKAKKWQLKKEVEKHCLTEDQKEYIKINEEGFLNDKNGHVKRLGYKFIRRIASKNDSGDTIYFSVINIGRGYEVSVRTKTSIALYDLERSYGYLVNDIGNINLGEGVSIFYAELYAFYLALLVVDDYCGEYKKIAGDNKEILKFFYGEYNIKDFKPYEQDVINAITELKEVIESIFPIEIFYIDKEDNPAHIKL